jgi:uncharacterized membrane protein YebE (DUF533 family)
VDILAAKVLIDWLRNRQQLLVPFTLDLQKLDASLAKCVVHAMGTAALADGTFDEKTRARLDAALERIHATDEQRALLEQALEKPLSLREALGDTRDPQTGAIYYAASLLAIDRRKRVNRYYLRYLSARLQLSPELARNLERRFSAAN